MAVSNKDFNLNLYSESKYDSQGTIQPASGWNGTNSSTSIACATRTNVTEHACNWCVSCYNE